MIMFSKKISIMSLLSLLLFLFFQAKEEGRKENPA